MAKPQTINEDFKPIIYKIKMVYVITNENHYTNGENPDNEERTSFAPEGNGVSIVNCIEKFVHHNMQGHKLNEDELFFTESKDGEYLVEYTAMSSTHTSMWEFKEPSQKEWEDYKEGKANLKSFVYQMSIVKEQPLSKEDLEKEGIYEY